MYGYPQMNQYMPNMYMQQEQQKQEVVKVNGINGANAVNLPPNSSLLALDMSGLLVWLITTDGAGYKTVYPYDITPHQEEKKPDYSDFESRLSALEKKMEGLANASADTATVTRSADKQHK